jgi:hypothetical protein
MLATLMSYCLLGLVRLLTGSQARWWGCPPKTEQRIYFANHQSHADLVMMALKFPNIELIPDWINNVQRVMPQGEGVPVPVLCSVNFRAPVACWTGWTRCALPLRCSFIR